LNNLYNSQSVPLKYIGFLLKANLPETPYSPLVMYVLISKIIASIVVTSKKHQQTQCLFGFIEISLLTFRLALQDSLQGLPSASWSVKTYFIFVEFLQKVGQKS
jgi:hypothetical protein